MDDYSAFDGADFSGDYPALTSGLIALQGNKTKRASFDRQQALADMLRQRAIAGQGVVNAPAGNSATSRVTVNPLAAVADIYGAYKSGQMQNDIDTGRSGLDADTQRQSTGLIGALTRMRNSSRGVAPGTQPRPGTPAAAALAQPLYADPNDYSMVP